MTIVAVAMMDAEFERQVEALFHELADVPAADRAAMIAARCGDQPRVRERLQRLLALHDEGCDPGLRTLAVVEDRDAASGAPRRIAQYQIVRLIGEGGMGTVYEAIQERPHRTVALKVIRPAPGMLSPKLLRRFELEAEILARLQHPGIAQIFEAGTFDAGQGAQPYFAMEFVQGQTLIKYAGHHQLSTRDRLELLARICDAVQHAHQRGVVHRDLKPGNILVTEVDESKAEGQPSLGFAASMQPKILDFGVARLTDSDIAVTTLQTDVHQLIGTLPYMSPEQVAGSGGAIDARADVYALGVIGYELLSGRLPVDVSGKSVPEAARIIRDDEPRTLGTINRVYRGELDTIIAKALEKDKARRYQSAAELAADIRRYLADLPIVARAPSRIYLLRKFARRNKGLVAGVAAAFVVLIAATIVSSVFAVRATKARDAARWQAYLANIAAADSALQINDVTTARRRLLEVNEADRGAWEWRYLFARLDDSVMRFGSDDDPVQRTIACSPDGARLVMGSIANDVLVWDVASGAQVSRLKGHIKDISDVAISPDGALIASSSHDNTIRIWDASAGEVIRVLAHEDSVYQVEFLPDGIQLISRSRGGVLRLWNARSGDLLKTHAFERFSPSIVAVHPNQEMLAYGTGEGDIVLFSVANWRIEGHCRGHSNSVTALAFSPDGSRLASASNDETVRFWNWREADELLVIRRPADIGTALAYSPRGDWLALGTTRGTIDILDSTSGDTIVNMRGHTMRVFGLIWMGVPNRQLTGDWGPLPDGSRLASISSGVDHFARIWNPKASNDAHLLALPKYNASSLAYSPDGARLAAMSADGLVSVWQPGSRHEAMVFGRHDGHGYGVTFSPDGSLLASTGDDSTIRLWNAQTGEPHAVLRGHTGAVLCAGFSRDGKFLATGGGDRTIRLWDVVSQRELAVFTGHHERVGAVAFSPDGTRVASGGHDATARLWDVATGNQIAEIKHPWTIVMSVAFSPDGQTLITSCDHVRFFDARTGEPLNKTLKHPEVVTRIALSSDGQRLFSTSTDGSLRIWHVPTAAEILVLRGHQTQISAMALDPAGISIATSAQEPNVRIWDARPAAVRLKASDDIQQTK